MSKTITKSPDRPIGQSAIERDPFSFLGPHSEPDGRVVVRAFHPAATSVEVRTAGGVLVPMSRVDEGLYEARLTSESDASDYRLVIAYPGGHVLEVDDPYRFGRVLTDFDLHLFSEGTHHRAFEKMGAHRVT